MMNITGPNLVAGNVRETTSSVTSPITDVCKDHLSRSVEVTEGDTVVSKPLDEVSSPPPVPPRHHYKTSRAMMPLPDSCSNESGGEVESEGDSDLNELEDSVEAVLPAEPRKEGKKIRRSSTFKMRVKNMARGLSGKGKKHNPSDTGEQQNSYNKSQSSPSPARRTMSKRERHLSETKMSLFSDVLNIENDSSPLFRAVKEEWKVQLSEIPPFERNRIRNHCFHHLVTSTLDFMLDERAVYNDIKSCLRTYVSAYEVVLPNLCGCLKLKSPVWARDIIKAARDKAGFYKIINKPVSDESREPFIQTVGKVLGVIFDGVINEDDFVNMNYKSKIKEIDLVKESIRLFNVSFEGCDDEGYYYLTHLLKDIQVMEGKLDCAATGIKTVMENDFRNEWNWDDCIDIIKKSARQAVSHSVSLVESVEKWKPVKSCPENLVLMAKDIKDNQDALLRLGGISKEQFKSKRLHVILQAKAITLHKKVMHLHDGKYYPVEISHTPPACLRIGQEGVGDYDPFWLDGHFVPSCQRKAEHAVNAYITRVTCAGKSVVEEVRIGSPYAFAISDSTERSIITKTRLDEMLFLCGLAFRKEEMEAALNNFDKTVSFPVFYNCFLSPDPIRKYLPAAAGGEDEKEWCREIFERTESMNGENVMTLTVRMRDGTTGMVRVKPDFFMFVCPCNEFGFEAGLRHKTWVKADSITKHAFEKLFGKINPDSEMTPDCFVRKFLDDNKDIDPVVRHEIEEVSNLLRYLFHNKVHHDLREQPFFFPTAISELGQLMNTAIACGCKSAKDRTGNYQRFRMYMATNLHLVREDIRSELKQKYGDKYMNLKPHSFGKIYPPIDKEATPEDIYNMASMLLCSGQVDLAKYNLGKLILKVPEFTLGPIKKLHPVVKPG